MNKRLFLRFFKRREDQIPQDSWHIHSIPQTDDEVSMAIKENALEMAQWIIKHPEGKVDLVWL